MVLLRHLLGDALRRLRLRQGRTLREVSAGARVSLGYLSEVERGQKEASSELLAAICSALGIPLSQVMREVADSFALAELQNEPVLTGMREPSLAQPGRSGLPGRVLLPSGALRPTPESAASFDDVACCIRDVGEVDVAQMTCQVPAVTEKALSVGGEPGISDVTRHIRDVTDMVPV